MNAWRHLRGLGLLLALTGCIPMSLNPIHTADVLVDDDRLVGVWGGSEENAWTIVHDGHGRYRMTARENDATYEYEAHLIRLEDTLFLDLKIQSGPNYPDDIYQLQLVPAHTFFKVVLTENSLRLDSLNIDWLVERADRGRLYATHVRIDEFDNLPVFTCSPKRMQRFLRRWAHDEEAWSVGDEAPKLRSAA